MTAAPLTTFKFVLAAGAGFGGRARYHLDRALNLVKYLVGIIAHASFCVFLVARCIPKGSPLISFKREINWEAKEDSQGKYEIGQVYPPSKNH